MNTLDETIRQMMLDWPQVWHHRAMCLDRIFIEGRHGWNGEPIKLTSVDLARGLALEETREKYVERQAQSRKDFVDRPEAYEGMEKEDLKRGKEFFERRIVRIKGVFKDFDATVAGAGSDITAHFTPMTPNCRYAGTLQRMADSTDAPADWVAGAREACALILACPFEETEGKNLARNKRIARKVLKALDKNYGKGETPDISYATWNEAHPFSETVALRKRMKALFPDKPKRKKAKKSA
jgi:hypothetical protein